MTIVQIIVVILKVYGLYITFPLSYYKFYKSKATNFKQIEKFVLIYRNTLFNIARPTLCICKFLGQISIVLGEPYTTLMSREHAQ